MKSWERWVVLAALLVWPGVFAFVSSAARLEPWLSNVLLVAGWAVILGIFVLRIYRAAASVRDDVARQRTDHPGAVVSAVILTTLHNSSPAEGLIVVLVADTKGVRLTGRNSGVIGEVPWRSVLKLTPLDRNLVLVVTDAHGGTEEWRVAPCETDFIRPVSTEKRDALLARLEELRAG